MAKNGMTVKALNLPQVEQDIKRFKGDIQDAVREAVAESAKAVAEGTRELVNVNTGALRDGVTIIPTGDGLGAQVGWSDPDLYYATFQEFGTTSIPANPALTSAAEIEREQFTARTTEILNGVIK